MILCSLRRLICAILVLCLTLSITNAALAADDITPPIISDICVEEQAQSLSPGDTFTLKCKIEDASGVESLSTYFQHDVRIGRAITPKSHYDEASDQYLDYSYNEATGYYEMLFEIPLDTVNGKWFLDHIQVYDVHGNRANVGFYSDRTHWIYVVNGIDDITPPAISDICVEEQAQSLSPGDTFTLKCRIEDTSGIESISTYFQHDVRIGRAITPKSHYDEASDQYLDYSYNEATGYYEMLFEIPPDTVNGKWFLDHIQVYDVHGNRANVGFYSDRTHWIYVVNGIDDITPPIISDICVEEQAQSLSPGDTFTLKCRIEDTSGIESISTYFQHDVRIGRAITPKSHYDEASDQYLDYSYNEATGYYEMLFEIPPDTVNGKWFLDHIQVYDVHGNRANVGFYSDRTHWIMITEATQTYIDGVIGTPSDGKIVDVPVNKKYQIRADYGRWADYWYRVNADGSVGDPITSQTKYEDIAVLQGTSIIGLSNGYHYTLVEVRETATLTNKVRIPEMPVGTNYVVYELSPFDSMYEYLTSQKKAGESPLGAYDIDVSGDIPEEGVLVSFNVGTRHSGKTLNVLHYHNDEVKRYEGVVDARGVITVRVFGFSPFMIVDVSTTPMPDPGDSVNNEPNNSTGNRAVVSNASGSIKLFGEGLSIYDVLITDTISSGVAYNAMLTLARDNEIFGIYDISLRSGARIKGNSMELCFYVSPSNVGQDFTLVHQKADGTYEYFYDAADVNGELSFDPLYELSPFMLVKGILVQTPIDFCVLPPKTGDAPAPGLWVITIFIACTAMLVSSTILTRKKR